MQKLFRIIKKLNINIYPNPSRQNFTFNIKSDIKGKNNYSINVYDIKGRKVKAIKTKSLKKEGYYSADDKDGYNVYLSYKEDDDYMTVTIDAPSE